MIHTRQQYQQSIYITIYISIDQEMKSYSLLLSKEQYFFLVGCEGSCLVFDIERRHVVTHRHTHTLQKKSCEIESQN